jgi:hypothetical protein
VMATTATPSYALTSVECWNCGGKFPRLEIAHGVSVADESCPTCGCNTLHKTRRTQAAKCESAPGPGRRAA